MKYNWSGYQFIPEAGRATYFPMAYFIIHAYWRAARHPYWPLRIPVLGVFSKHSARWHYAVRDSQVFDSYLERFLETSKRMQEFEKYISSQRSHVRRLFGRESYSDCTNIELGRFIELFYNCFQDLIVAAGTLRYLDRALVPALQRAYSSHANVDARVATASMGSKPSFALREENAMLTLASRLQRQHMSIQSDTAITGIQKIWSIYRWSSCGYYNEQVKTKAIYTAELRALLKKNPVRALHVIQLRIRTDKQQRHAALRMLLSRDRRIGILAGQATVAKDEYRFVASELIGRAMPLFTEIACRTGYSVDAIHELLPLEVTSVLQGKPYPSLLVRARTRHAIAIYGPGRTFDLIIGRTAEAFALQHLHKSDRGTSRLHGRAASPGIVRGIVRVVLGVHDFHKVRRGDILVCLNTSPEFMPVLRKIAGMIGEEGGLTAHVSVISRELGIPCIVNVIGATVSLKDGDRVEVDANSGIVKRL